ncbi:copper chaperone PCu(A)C [Roseibium sp. LAB1]
MRALAVLLPLLFCLSHPAWASGTHTASEASHGNTETHRTHEEAEHNHEEDEDSHEGRSEGVRALHAWIRETSGTSALLFVNIENMSERQVKLIGGHTGVASQTQLVGFALKDGEPGYDALPPVPIQPGKTLALAPNALALRLGGLTRSFRKGEEFEIEIEFDFGHIEMHVQVESMNATRHSHAGHQH